MRRPSLFSAYSTYSKQIKKTKFTKLHLEFAESCLDLLGIYLNYLSSRFKQNKYGDILLMRNQGYLHSALSQGGSATEFRIIYYSQSSIASMIIFGPTENPCSSKRSMVSSHFQVQQDAQTMVMENRAHYHVLYLLSWKHILPGSSSICVISDY
jgi:hypothetical protein